jgi:hypothetical protein
MNIIYWFIVKQKFLLTLYELSAGSYMIFMILAYWVPGAKHNLSLVNIPAVVAIIALNFYFTVFRKKVDIKELIPDIDDTRAEIARRFSVTEMAKAVAVMLAAPAYITCGLLSVELLKSYI